MDPLSEHASRQEREEVASAILSAALGREVGASETASYVAHLSPQGGTLDWTRTMLGLLYPFKAPRFVPPGHHYSPITPTDEVNRYVRMIENRPHNAPLSDVGIDHAAMLSLWRELLPHLARAPFGREARPPLRYRFENGAYDWGDGSVLHAMILHVRPRRIIEVGSGWSTICTLDTIETRLDAPCEVTIIEPFPELAHRLVGSGRAPARVIAEPVQNVPLETFDALEENDILFIDSTHVVRTGSDVCHEIFEILPRLKAGVLVHFHDVFWPFEYPRTWAVDENRSWSEIYLLRALLSGNPRWRIVMFNDYFAKLATEEIAETYPDFLRNPGGALWLRRTET